MIVNFLQKIIQELVDKSNEQEEEFQEIKADVEALRLNLHLTRNNVKNHTEKIKELESMIGGVKQPVAAPVLQVPSESNLDINALG